MAKVKGKGKALLAALQGKKIKKSPEVVKEVKIEAKKDQNGNVVYEGNFMRRTTDWTEESNEGIIFTSTAKMCESIKEFFGK